MDDRSKHLLIGTAGHVDHGKTALIGALTGVDTDRLEEEHDRGISIVLGFASYQPMSDLDAQVGIIDVPGHERFIKTMVAGATGVDVALFVIASDESVKPQTLEHLEILTLLGVEHGVIALTKVDLVEDHELVELVTEEVRDLVAGTFLADASIVPVSSITGEGLDELRGEIEALLSVIPERRTGAGFRMPIDRSFSIKGIGTVVTGSVWTGSVKVGDPVEIQPSGISTRVREIQQHGESAPQTAPGTRTAVAIHSVSVSEAVPGSWLVSPGSFEPSRTIDLQIDYLKSAPGPLKHNQRVRIHHGTQETFGRLRLIGLDAFQPGDEGFAQLHLEEPLVALVGDRLLIRRYSPRRTIAGATVLDINPARHRRSDGRALERLEVRAQGDPLEIVASMVSDAGLRGVEPKEAIRRSSLSRDQLQESAGAQAWLILTDRIVDCARIEEAIGRIVGDIETFHKSHPLKRGFSSEEIASILGVPAGGSVLEAVLSEAEKAGLIEKDPPFWRKTDFRVLFEGPYGEAFEKIISASEARDITPLNQGELDELIAASIAQAGLSLNDAGELIDALVHQERLIRYPGGFFQSARGHQKLVSLLKQHFGDHESLSVPEFRELTSGLTRKFVIPILEYMDSEGVTMREGDLRVPGPSLS
ncbi:selenocysteine-specific translation elongation factor [Gemmatimonadota bacterium]